MTTDRPDAPRVLIVDDDSTVAVVVTAALEAIGYGVAGRAREGGEALRMTADLRPDIILMDVNLEGAVDGIEAAATIHDQFGTPVVFLTSQVDDETLDRARAAEPHGYLVKPLEPRMLRPTLEMALHKHRMELERAELTHRLQDALDEVDQLRGLLPLCAWCGRVKDDQGYWDTLQAYLSKRLRTAYTHGICAECAKEFEGGGDGAKQEADR